jgi:hypothetical protein
MNVNIGKSRKKQLGFALVTTLLLLVLVTGLAIAVMYLATTQKQISGSDSESSEAYYGGEAAMEKMMADLADLYQQKQTPSLADLAALSSQQPAIPGISYSDPNVTNAYTLTALDNGSGFPASYSSTVASGPNQGLVAQIIPINLAVTARRAEGTEVRMFRKVEVALIPVFQFGVFCDADCSYFPGPDFQFAGRVHTNGNLWLAAGGTLTFYDKITAYGNVIRKQLANTYDTTSGSYNGTINLPTASSGCGTYPSKSGSNCAALAFDQGSVTAGNFCAGGLTSAPNCDSNSVKNTKWPTISGPGGIYGSMLLNGDTTVTKLSLPFVGANVSPIEIIRKAQSGDSSILSASRLYNQASIRILLDDNPYNLSSSGPADPENIPLAAVSTGGKVDSSGWGTLAAGKTYYFATATNASDLLKTVDSKNKTVYGPDPNWVVPSTTAGTTANQGGSAPTGVVDPFLYQTGATPDSADGKQTVKYPEAYLKATKATDWPLLSGWLRVEIQTKVGATPVGVTREWLALGFTRQFSQFPNSEAGVTNGLFPNAILLLQQQMNPNRIVTAYDSKGKPSSYGDTFNATYAASSSGYDFLPINFYDPREGELRDTTTGKTAGSCSINGLMNAVELDVGNLNRWLKGSIGTKGTSVDNTTYNGYILYFSDRRGGSKDGGYDYLDTVNATNSINVTSTPTASKNVTTGIPDGVLSAEEDVYQGAANYPAAIGGSGGGAATLITPPRYIGSAFGLGQITTSSPGVSQRISCSTTGAWNVVLAPRHALRLVNGSLGNVPKSAAGTGGFTVASEQPVYVVGNYNANAANPLPQTTTTDSAAAVIADTVTLLSTAYSDQTSLGSPFTPTQAKDSYYRLAIASGKTLTFKRPSSSDPQDFGTDGGVHNFLRYIENWGGANLYYEGSMVSLYYSAYATGAFKCCTTVYSPPSRHYSFDTNFLTPSLLPPGTPQFKDVVDLGFQQSLTP